jgi:hypothetical protein
MNFHITKYCSFEVFSYHLKLKLPMQPDASAQTTGEDTDHKVSEVACGTPTDKSGPDQHSPLVRPTPHPGKKEKKPE